MLLDLILIFMRAKFVVFNCMQRFCVLAKKDLDIFNFKWLRFVKDTRNGVNFHWHFTRKLTDMYLNEISVFFVYISSLIKKKVKNPFFLLGVPL